MRGPILRTHIGNAKGRHWLESRTKMLQMTPQDATHIFVSGIFARGDIKKRISPLFWPTWTLSLPQTLWPYRSHRKWLSSYRKWEPDQPTNWLRRPKPASIYTTSYSHNSCLFGPQWASSQAEVASLAFYLFCVALLIKSSLWGDYFHWWNDQHLHLGL